MSFSAIVRVTTLYFLSLQLRSQWTARNIETVEYRCFSAPRVFGVITVLQNHAREFHNLQACVQFAWAAVGILDTT